MAHSTPAAKDASRSSHVTEHVRRLELVPAPSAKTEFDSEPLEIAYGGGWDSFDSDDIEALRETRLVWLPPALDR